eukprot:355863-Chlamydomonas_euryale.AAC.1
MPCAPPPVDPHARYLPGVSAAQPGLKIAFLQADLAGQFPDAARPYRHFGCTMRRRFDGTLFRFPLRSGAAAAASEIKPVACTPHDVLALLHALREQLPAALLFLKSVKKVTAWVCRPAEHPAAPSGGGSSSCGNSSGGVDGGGTDATGAEAVLLYEARAEVVCARNSGGGGGSGACGAPLQSSIAEFIAAASTDVGGGGGGGKVANVLRALSRAPPTSLPSAVGTLQLSVSSGASSDGGGGGGGSTSTWVVCNALSAGAPLAIAERELASGGAKMIPWVGVAARLDTRAALPADDRCDENNNDEASDGSCSDGGGSDGDRGGGRGCGERGGTAGSTATPLGVGVAFCFLPLPARTGLPLH